jgi:hypothetical protein
MSLRLRSGKPEDVLVFCELLYLQVRPMLVSTRGPPPLTADGSGREMTEEYVRPGSGKC